MGLLWSTSVEMSLGIRIRFNESIGKFALTKQWSCRSASEYTLWSSHSLRESWKISSLSVWFCDAKHKAWFIAAGFLLLFHVEDICKCMFHWHRTSSPQINIIYAIKAYENKWHSIFSVTLYLKNIMFDLHDIFPHYSHPTRMCTFVFIIHTLHKYVSK